MNEWWLLICFLILLLPAIRVVLYPLRKSRVVLLLAPILMVLIGFGYWHWGAGIEWVNYLHAGEKQQRIQTMLKSMKDPAEVIDKLKQTLQAQPDSARGWYLLGRLYASQNQWQSANDAFERAHALQPDDEQIAVNYAQNLWQLNHQQYNDVSRGLLNDILNRNANQPDTLAMLAMDAYQQKNYQLAIDYWQRLLKLVPPQSEESNAIRKAIARAQRKL